MDCNNPVRTKVNYFRMLTEAIGSGQSPGVKIDSKAQTYQW